MVSYVKSEKLKCEKQKDKRESSDRQLEFLSKSVQKLRNLIKLADARTHFYYQTQKVDLDS